MGREHKNGHHDHNHNHDHDHHHDHDHDHAHVQEERPVPEITSGGRIAHPHGDHDHHGHSHDHARETDKKRLLLTLALTGAILVAEVIGGFLSGSLALLSDAGHVLTDASAQLLSLLALLFASRPADKRRTYGYYRLEILAALANGVALVALAGFILYSAWKRIDSPPEVKTGLMLVVAAAGLVANLVAARLLHRAHTLNARGAYLHIVSDTLASAAVVVGGLIMLATGGLYILDPILGVVIAIVVLWSAIRLIREAIDILLEAVPSSIDLEKVRDDVLAVDGIADVHDLHIWTITSGMYALSAHVVVKHGHACDNDALLTRIKQVLLDRHRIGHSTLQLESTEYEHIGHVH
jgi:cobalt-zinc-cadmium efflux system protein